MPSFLDAYPVNWSDARVEELRDALAASFYRALDIEQIAVSAGLSPADIAWGHPARTLWYETINVAAGQRLLDQLVAQAGSRSAGMKARIDELLAPEPIVASKLPAGEPSALAQEDPRWKNFGSERQIVAGDETLLDISFLERGLLRAKSVCRLTVSATSGLSYGTAFRIGPSLLLTNHHVLYDWEANAEPALSVHAEFGYETDLAGKLRTPTVVSCDVATIRGERDQDFAVISVSEAMPDDAGELALTGARSPEVDDRVYIIQHPRGLPKKIAMAHNLVRHVDDDVVQYWTDTDAGSSGSPVFDERWDVVALHHQWAVSPADDGNAYRNQGRNIRTVEKRLAALGGS